MQSILFAAIKLSPANSAVLQVAEAMWQHVRVESPTIRPDLARYAEGVMQAMRDVCGKSGE